MFDILRYVILPFFALAHGYAAAIGLLASPASYAKQFGMPNEGPEDSSMREKILLDCVAAFHVATCYFMAVAILSEQDDLHVNAAVFEVLFSFTCLVQANRKLPFKEAIPPLVFTSVALVGAIYGYTS